MHFSSDDLKVQSLNFENLANFLGASKSLLSTRKVFDSFNSKLMKARSVFRVCDKADDFDDDFEDDFA